jgi:HPt (histidine-containing phosphotransfer) domain-containing protein
MASAVDPMDLEITQVLIKPLAYEMLESNLGKEASLDILKAFLGSTAQLVLELQVALCKQNTREATLVLREIESSCTVVGANGVLDQCFMMEEHLQKSDWKALDGCMIKLAQETGLVSQFINQLLSQAIRKHFRR